MKALRLISAWVLIAWIMFPMAGLLILIMFLTKQPEGAIVLTKALKEWFFEL